MNIFKKAVLISLIFLGISCTNKRSKEIMSTGLEIEEIIIGEGVEAGLLWMGVRSGSATHQYDAARVQRPDADAQQATRL